MEYLQVQALWLVPVLKNIYIYRGDFLSYLIFTLSPIVDIQVAIYTLKGGPKKTCPFENRVFFWRLEALTLKHVYFLL